MPIVSNGLSMRW